MGLRLFFGGVVGAQPKAVRGQLVRWQVLRALRSVHVELQLLSQQHLAGFVKLWHFGVSRVCNKHSSIQCQQPAPKHDTRCLVEHETAATISARYMCRPIDRCSRRVDCRRIFKLGVLQSSRCMFFYKVLRVLVM